MNKAFITRLLLVTLMLYTPTVMSAQHRDSKKAYAIAKDFLGKQYGETQPLRAKGIVNSETLQGAKIQPYYIFNDTLSHSFVIISGDERMKTILGSCDTQIFNPDIIPCGLSWFLEHYTEQFEALEDYNENCNTSHFESRKVPSSDILPILTSEWDQTPPPYSDNVPSGCPAGCVATAMGQIMYHYKYPERGSGKFSYTSRTKGYRLSYDFENSYFNWSIMQDLYDNNNYGSTESRRAVADLLKACGVSVAMNYTEDGSGASETSIPYALKEFFRFNDNVVVYERDYYKSSEWYEKVYEELLENHPILYCGLSKSGGRDAGHAFIIDGFRRSDGQFHVNWGWGGRYDGYYELDALNPPNGYRFSSGQCMIARFCPEKMGYHEDIFYAEDFSTADEIKPDVNMSFELTGLINYSSSSSYAVSDSYFNGVVGIGLFDSDYTFLKKLAEKNIKVRYDRMKTLNLPVMVHSEDIEKGKNYYIAPYVKSESAETPTRIRTIGGKTDCFTITQDGEVDPDDDEPVEKDVILNESFDSMTLPLNWSQEKVSGEGIWENKIVLVGNDNSDTPRPVSGIGYTCLEYNSGLLFNSRTITRLITPKLTGDATSQFMLSCQCRNFTTQISNTNVLTVLIDRECNGQWEVLIEQAVLNQNKWLQLQIPFVASGTYRIAIEGSVDHGGLLFVDDVKVARLENNTSILSHIAPYTNESTIFTLYGQRLTIPQKGIMIIGRKKILIK